MSLRRLFSEFYSTYTYKLNTLLVSLCSKKNNNNNTVKPYFMDARLIPTPQGLLWISSDRDDRRFHARREVSDDEA